MPALEPYPGTQAADACRGALARVPFTPGAGGHWRDGFGAAPSASKRTTLVCLSWHDRPSVRTGRGDRPAPRTTVQCIVYRASHTTHNEASKGVAFFQQDNCLSGSLVRLKRPVMFQSRVERPSTLTGTAWMDRTVGAIGIYPNICPEPTTLPFAIGPQGSSPQGCTMPMPICCSDGRKTTRLDLSETW